MTSVTGTAEFSGAKQVLHKALERLEGLVRTMEDPNGIRRLAELRRKLSGEEFQIVVMGKFKSGKSSLINALIGQSILPTGVVPLTSVVTVVRPGDTVEARVTFLDGREVEIPLSQVPEFVGEEQNPKNKRGVQRVTVHLPLPHLPEGVVLVDTPGIGSIYRHNTEVAQRYLPEVDALVLVLTVDPPIGEAELEFLHSARRWAKQLFVVLNKIDYLEGAAFEESVSFTRRVLEEAAERAEIPFFPISARWAADPDAARREKSGLTAFASALTRFLIERKGALVLESVRSRVHSLIDGLLLKIDLQMKASAGETRELEAGAAHLRAFLETARRRQFELATLFEADLKAHLQVVEETIYRFTHDEERRLQDKISALYQNVKHLPGSQMREKLNSAFMEGSEEGFSRFLGMEEPRWAEQFQEMANRYLERTLDLINEVLTEAAQSFGLPFQPMARPVIRVDAPAIWFEVEEVSIWSSGMHRHPTLRLLRPFFLKAVRSRLAETMERNAGRMRSDYAYRTAEAGRRVRGQIEDLFASSTEAVSQALETLETRKTRSAAEVAEMMARLARWREALTTCRQELTA